MTHRVPAIQIIRTTEELFVPDQVFKDVLGLGPDDIVLNVERKSGVFRAKGSGGEQTLDLMGVIVTIRRARKEV